MLKVARQFLAFALARRRLWLVPLILALLLVGALVLAGEVAPLTPFFYPL